MWVGASRNCARNVSLSIRSQNTCLYACKTMKAMQDSKLSMSRVKAGACSPGPSSQINLASQGDTDAVLQNAGDTTAVESGKGQEGSGFGLLRRHTSAHRTTVQSEIFFIAVSLVNYRPHPETSDSHNIRPREMKM